MPRLDKRESDSSPPPSPALMVAPPALARSAYPVYIGAGLLAKTASLLQAAGAPGGENAKAIIVSDSQVAPLYAGRLQRSLEAGGWRCLLLTVAAGEASKDLDVLKRLLNQSLNWIVRRDSLIIALGGGVVGDLAGLLAALLLRGLPLAQCATSLVAQVDSAVGGKTSVNAHSGKNLVGAFHQPLLVVCDSDCFATLDERQLRAGYAEILKYALIGDRGMFDQLESGGGAALLARQSAALHSAVRRCCQAKAALVSEDEREQGRRALLNLGHSFGHALETAAAHRGQWGQLLHGEAVAAGLALAFGLSARLGFCAEADSLRLRRHLVALGLLAPGLKALAEIGADRLLHCMAKDKKNTAAGLTLILVRGIGRAFINHGHSADALRPHLQALLDALRESP